MLLAVLSLVALAVAAVAVVRLDFSRSGLDPLRDAVSDYGTTPLHLVYRLQVVGFGLAALLLLAALATSDRLDVPTAGLVWLGVFGAARIAIAAFMIDHDVAPPTREGRVHLLLATLAFTAIAVAAAGIGTDLGGVFETLGWIVVVSAVATGLFRIVPALSRFFGAVERLLYAATVWWIAAVAIEILR